LPKITPQEKSSKRTVTVKTHERKNGGPQQWWKARSAYDRTMGLMDTAAFLTENLAYRYRQASVYSRLYSNMPLFGALAGTRIAAGNMNLPIDRPTMNVIQSCTDTLVSRISQARPRPVFLTDNGDYKERRSAKQFNQFIAGELYQTEAYELAPLILTDAAVLGTGCIKILEKNKRVALERRLLTELLVDINDGRDGRPRCLYEKQLVDRSVLEAMFPGKGVAKGAEEAYPDNGAESSKSASDLVMVIEGWRLESSPGAGDGRHTIACVGVDQPLLDEEWAKDDFPFVFLHYSPRMLGFWGQPLAEQLMGTQMEINKLLITISQAINLVGVPRVFVEDGSKVVKAHLNNQVGSIVTYRGTKPQYEVAPCVPAEVYSQLQRLVDYAYQQSGISALSASSQKPSGLDSGAAIREYDDLQSDRFAALNRRYDNLFIDLAYQIIDLARDIAKRDGKYETIYPGKDGTRSVDLPKAALLDNPFVIQCFDSSALPRDPAGRIQKAVEWLQAGAIDIKEFRRLAQFPDLEQMDKLSSAGEERVFCILDQIVEEGKYTPPDPFLPLDLAKEYSAAYYNLYVVAKLPENKAEMLRTFNTQCVALLTEASMAAQGPAMQGSPAGQPAQAVPQPLPQSPMLPQAA
jgi:hypothetical protein